MNVDWPVPLLRPANAIGSEALVAGLYRVELRTSRSEMLRREELIRQRNTKKYSAARSAGEREIGNQFVTRGMETRRWPNWCRSESVMSPLPARWLYYTAMRTGSHGAKRADLRCCERSAERST